MGLEPGQEIRLGLRAEHPEGALAERLDVRQGALGLSGDGEQDPHVPPLRLGQVLRAQDGRAQDEPRLLGAVAQGAVHLPCHPNRSQPPVPLHRRGSAQPEPGDPKHLLEAVVRAGAAPRHLDRPHDRHGRGQTGAAGRPLLRTRRRHRGHRASLLLLRRRGAVEAQIQHGFCQVQEVPEELHTMFGGLRCTGELNFRSPTFSFFFLSPPRNLVNSNDAQDRNLDRMTRIAAGSENMDVEDWMPSKIYLSVPLMWEILQFNSTADSQGIPSSGLLDASLTPAVPPMDTSDSSTLEIIVATSPEITINIADGGQEAPTSSYKKAPLSSSGLRNSTSTRTATTTTTTTTTAASSSSSSSSRAAVFDPPSVEQIDSLTFNTTPWLYADPSQLVGIGDMSFPPSEPGNAWWEGENFNSIMFNQF
ncbi:hypothetical protein CGRA01v4_12164 [Colletotrichum graminicola]|nr:hypothetical protein CGRA01v4_12164 [Colletotrichum graminicola]